MEQRLTIPEGLAKEILERRFVPILHHTLSTANPVAYKQWQGNCCRQTAVFGVKLLERLLPSYKWQAWDGDFRDELYGKPVTYNHSWIYGVDKEKNRGLLVDMARDYRERLFILAPQNKYPKDHPEYAKMRLTSKTKLDVEHMLDDLEWYTNRPSRELLAELTEKVLGI